MTIFRPCIDLHEGRVKQIVGGSLTDEGARENFVSEQPASWFAERYERDALVGGHVIQLGPGNEQAACDALAAYPSGLQIGGGITTDSGAVAWARRVSCHRDQLFVRWRATVVRPRTSHGRPRGSRALGH